MKTKLITLATLFFLCVTAGYAKDIKGNGTVITKDIQISDYTELRIGGNINIDGNNFFSSKGGNKGPVFNYMQKAGKSSLQITIDENLLPQLEINVSNGCLSIRTNNKDRLFPTKLIINSSSAKLEEVKISGCVDFILQNNFTGDDLKMNISGSGDIYLNKPVRIANTYEIKVSGSGDMKANNLTCRNIEASISGSGDLDLKGKAESGEYKVTGSGDIHAYGFVVKDLKCKVSGSGDIEANATETLDASTSGSGDIRYKGYPRADIRSTGSGDIKRIK